MRNAGSLLSFIWVGAFTWFGSAVAYAQEPLADVAAEAEVDALRNNPFSRPAKLQPKPDNGRGQRVEAATQLTLTGTLVGEASFANIGGKVFAVGEEVNGQTLVEVHDRYVVLTADNRRVELWVSGDDQSD